MSQERLRQLIDSEPANAGRTDQQVYTWLEENHPSEADDLYLTEIDLISVLGATAANDTLKKLEEFAATGLTSQQQVVGRYVRHLMSGGINLGDKEVRVLFDRLATAGVITSAERDGIKALVRRKKRWEAAGVTLHLGDIIAARAL